MHGGNGDKSTDSRHDNSKETRIIEEAFIIFYRQNDNAKSVYVVIKKAVNTKKG